MKKLKRNNLKRILEVTPEWVPPLQLSPYEPSARKFAHSAFSNTTSPALRGLQATAPVPLRDGLAAYQR